VSFVERPRPVGGVLHFFPFLFSCRIKIQNQGLKPPLS
jgi:hypothetical protein